MELESKNSKNAGCCFIANIEISADLVAIAECIRYVSILEWKGIFKVECFLSGMEF